MIVLRLTVASRSHELRLSRPEIRLGSSGKADVRVKRAGWRGHEATLRQEGTEVVLSRPGATSVVRLRVGDAVVLGRARVALIGLLPTEAAAPGAPPRADVPSAFFGDYDEDLAAARAPAGRAAAGAGASAGAGGRAGAAARKDAATEDAATQGAGAGKRTAGAASASAATAGHRRALGFEARPFGVELVEQLKRAPFFALSAGFHALVIVLLALILDAKDAGTERGEGGALRSALTESAPEERLQQEEAQEDGALPTPDLPESMDLAVPDIDDASPQQDDEASEGEVLEALPSRERTPMTIGVNPAMTAARHRVRPALPRVNMAQPFAKGDAGTANERAADYVRAQLGLGTGEAGDPLKDLERTDLLVVDGSFDNIARVLKALRLPYLVVSPMALAHPDAPDLDQHKVIFWNCGESLPPEQARIVMGRIREFVDDGGYLFTTDWAVGNVLMPAFPDYVSTNGPRAPLPEVVVDIRPARGALQDPLLQGVFPRGATGRWWLEQASFDLHVVKPRAVDVLIESPDLERMFGRDPTLAITFRHGRGRVLHVMGHYFQEAGNIAGTISAHRLALNFVLMRLGHLRR